jgi:type IV secretion system protein VirB4
MSNPNSVAFSTAREDYASTHIPFSSPVTDNIVSTHKGDYMSTWGIVGLSFEGLSNDEIDARMDALNLFIRGLSNGKFAFWIHRIRRRVTDELSLPESGFSRRLVEKYQDKLKNGGFMATELYMTVIYRPFPQQAGKRFTRAFGDKKTTAAAVDAGVVDVLDDLHNSIKSSLSKYGIARLGAYHEKGIKYNRQLEFYAYLINGHWWKIPHKKNMPISNYIAASRVKFETQLMSSIDTYGAQYFAFIDLKDYSEFTEPGMLNTLLSVPCEYVETQSFSPLTSADAAKEIKLQRDRLKVSKDDAVSQVQALDQALDDLISGRFSYGSYHYTMCVKGSTIDQVKEARSRVIEALQTAGSGFLAVPIDGVVSDAFWAQLPGNWTNRPRVGSLSSRNYCGMCALHNFSSGKRDGNPWGEAVAMLKTVASQPYYFNFHATEVGENSYDTKPLGNCQIIGQSGGGKTVLALFLQNSLSKFGTQTVYFDKDRGAEIAIRAMGGRYLSLERGAPSGFAPLKLEPTTQNMLFWEDIIKFCSSMSGRPHSPQEEIEINLAVRALSLMPKEMRCFEAVRQNLPQVDGDSVAIRLKKWCAGQKLGWALDGDEDLLEFEPGVPSGFDYTELLDDEVVMPAVMMYLMFRVENIIDGRRFAFFMDEYWKALACSYFEDFAKNKQKTIRKQNGFGVYMTQSPSDTLASPIARALIEQTATFIFLPNPTADYGDYVEGFKLSESEFQVVKALPEGSRFFLIKQGNKVAVATLDLKGFTDELKILSGTTDGIARLDSIRARVGDDPDDWIEPFLRGES